MRIAQVLEPFNMHWLEIDRYDPDALLQIKQSTTTKICTGENLYPALSRCKRGKNHLSSAECPQTLI